MLDGIGDSLLSDAKELHGEFVVGQLNRIVVTKITCDLKGPGGTRASSSSAFMRPPESITTGMRPREVSRARVLALLMRPTISSRLWASALPALVSFFLRHLLARQPMAASGAGRDHRECPGRCAPAPPR